MVLPVYTYGAPVLRQKAHVVEADSPELQQLIDDMILTMRRADGIGLAAPQVGRGQRVFVVDLSVLEDDLREEGELIPAQPMVFINPDIVGEFGEEVEFEEGCLSIPDIREHVVRPEGIRIRYLDRHFESAEAEFTGMLSRVVQHEYDHVEGILFVDRISPFRKRLLRRRLREMADGNVEADYPLAGQPA